MAKRSKAYRPGFSRGPLPEQREVAPRRSSESSSGGRSSRRSGIPRSWLLVGAIGALAIVAVIGYFAFFSKSAPVLRPPTATPLASQMAEPAGDGTTATIETELGTIVIELYTESSPVAAENFINLAEAGFYNGVGFHRIVPGFVIQGGDPTGTGSGGPPYRIEDEHVVGEYTRGIVAMARTTAPRSQGSQFFVVLADSVKDRLSKSGGYAIFGKVRSGMEVVDAIVAQPRVGETPNDPVLMTRVTIQRPV